MAIKKSYAVFGLGRYGIAVAKELLRNGADVLVVDIDEEKVNEVVSELPICKCADVTDVKVLEKLDIHNFDVVIIAMASNLEASVLTTTLCKEIGVKKVVVKCGNEMHQKIFKKVGADEVVFPEKESGTRLGKNLLSNGFVDMVELSDDIAILNIDVISEWIGKSLIDLKLRKKYGLNVIAINDKNNLSIEINPAEPLTADMELVVIINTNKVDKILKELVK